MRRRQCGAAGPDGFPSRRHVGSVAIDFAEPIASPTLVHSCVLHVDPSLPYGTVRLRHLDHTALDADGGALPSRGRDGILVIAPAGSPSPGLTPRPTRTPTPEPAPEVFIDGDPVAVRAGARATVSFRLTAGGHRVSGTQNDLEFAPGIAVAARAGGRPDCAVNPAIDKTATSFAFQPPGCTPGDDCRAVRALVLSFEDNAPIADGAVLYTCGLAVDSSVAPGAYALPIALAGTSTPEGQPLRTGAAPLRVTVEGALLARRALPAGAAARVCAGGGADGTACAGDADCPAGGSGCLGGGDGVCQGGDSDGACCDRRFTCRGGGACGASHRLCVGGPAKGSPCLGDGHCLGSACLASARRCAGGELDGVACIDAPDCPAGACVDPNAPTPTALATATARAEVPHVSGSDGCAVAPARHPPSGWWLAPGLLVLVRRRRRG